MNEYNERNHKGSEVGRILRTVAVCLIALADALVGFAMLGIGGCAMNKIYGVLIVLLSVGFAIFYARGDEGR